MKMIHGLTLALTLSTFLSLRAQETNTPTAPPLAAPIETAVTNPAPEIAPPPAPKPKAKAKPAAQKKAAPQAPPKDAIAEVSDTVKAINPPETGTVMGNNVNVRGQASFIGEVITKLNKGESVTLLEEITLGKTKKNEPANWFRIAMPASTPVWIHAGFIDSATKTVVPEELNVRAGPGENFSVVGELHKGDTVKEIRTVDNWIEIEPPASTYAFVTADLIERAAPIAPTVPEPVQPAPTPVPTPEPPPELVTVPPDQTAPVPAEPVAPPAAPTVVEPVESPAPVIVPEPLVEEPLPKRVVTREGIVRRSLNIQTPSYYELESLENGKVINYLYSPKPGFTLKTLIGERVIVTGEEIIDRRWRNTPVIEIETLRTR